MALSLADAAFVTTPTNALWNRAGAYPTLDLRFADSKSLVDAVTGQNLITFTRSSDGTYVDADGVLKTAASDVPRFDHNPTTGECLGLLVEEQRTNSIRNNTMVGAVAGTPGTLPTNWPYAVAGSGLTSSVVGTGIENGISYIDYRVNGIAASDTALSLGIDSAAAVTGQTWTASSYLKLAAGSTSGITSWNILVTESTSAFAFVAGADYPVSTPTATFVRSSVTRTLSGGATVADTNCAIRVFCTNGAAIDFTLRIGMPQLEQGAFATSVIPTTGSAATRNADVVSITGANFSSWYRQDEGTVFIDILRGYSGNFPGFPNILNFDDGTGSNLIALYGVQSTQNITNFSIQSGGVGQTDYVQVGSNVPGPNRISQAIAANSSILSANGTLTAQDSTVTMPNGINRIVIGSNPFFVAQWGGHIRRLTYWPARLPNSTLQELTR